jgi:hypothetical protein
MAGAGMTVYILYTQAPPKSRLLGCTGTFILQLYKSTCTARLQLMYICSVYSVLATVSSTARYYVYSVQSQSDT